MKKLALIILWLFLLGGECYAEGSPKAESAPKQTVGYMEKIKLYPGGELMLGYLKPDLAGATVHAEDIKRFVRKGKKWVRFTLIDIYGERTVVEREISRVAKIKQEDAPSIKRIVVELGICIGELYVEGEVKLADRSGRTQRVVIGRDILAGNVLIDPGRSHTVEPKCSNIPADKRD